MVIFLFDSKGSECKVIVLKIKTRPNDYYDNHHGDNGVSERSFWDNMIHKEKYLSAALGRNMPLSLIYFS